MGISRDDRRDRRDTSKTAVALDVVAGTWADPTGSYYEAWCIGAVSMDWFVGSLHKEYGSFHQHREFP